MDIGTEIREVEAPAPIDIPSETPDETPVEQPKEEPVPAGNSVWYIWNSDSVFVTAGWEE